MSPEAVGVALLCYAILSALPASTEWQCPRLSSRPAAECSCDMPYTLRCTGDHTALQIIGRHLREQRSRDKNSAVSLLDLALRGVSSLSAAAITELAGVGLHGLVVSSGDIRRIQQGAFSGIANTLLALGLPNNQLPAVPTEALTRLPKLDRLDLSTNKIHTLDSNSFKGLQNLTYLDLSYNQLTDISASAFKPLFKLSVLRLRGNLLKVAALTSLREARLLRELDLSSNALEGPLSGGTVPPLSCLTSLQLSDNTFASIRRGALAGLTNLTHLNLHNNQIDVLEDYAFKHLNNLTHLDLSHNEIVAVSGGSLAQLTSLVLLDLSHNFLRSLSAEPLKSLNQLSDLLVHDNDISMIDDGALADHRDLRRFTIQDNPLNCDCLMAGFARWLREAKNLSQSDKTAAACATPPHLEGALLSRLSKNKLCDDYEHLEPPKSNILSVTSQLGEEHYDYNSVLSSPVEDKSKVEIPKIISTDGQSLDYVDDYKISDGLDDDMYDEELDLPTADDLPRSKFNVSLMDASFDNEEVYLTWSVNPPSSRIYRCTEVSVIRGKGPRKDVACHRAEPNHVVVRGLKVDPIEMYTFCISFEEIDYTDIPVALVLGCSTPQHVRSRATYALPYITTPLSPLVRESNIRVSEVRSNVTSDGVLTVFISLMGFPSTPQYTLPRSQRMSSTDAKYLSTTHNCFVILEVLSRGSLVAQKDTRCQTLLTVSMEEFKIGPYKVCASISKFKSEDRRPICVVPQLIDNIGSLEVKAGFKNLNTALVGVSLGLMIIVIGLMWFVRRMLKKPTEFESHRCYRQDPVPEETPRASYVMLTATSKV